MNFSKVLKDITTVANGVTFDNIRIGALIALVALIGFQAFDLIVAARAFNPTEFGMGAAALFGGAGAGIAMKKKDEPTDD